jgi:hypothetical protein
LKLSVAVKSVVNDRRVTVVHVVIIRHPERSRERRFQNLDLLEAFAPSTP